MENLWEKIYKWLDGLDYDSYLNYFTQLFLVSFVTYYIKENLKYFHFNEHDKIVFVFIQTYLFMHNFLLWSNLFFGKKIVKFLVDKKI